MPVEIAEHHKLAFLMHVLNQLLAVIDRRLKCFRRKFPAPVEVATRQRASVVAVDNTVRVQHGNNLEHKVVPEDLSIEAGSHEVVDDALHHPAGVCLSGVDASSDDNALAQL